MQLYPVVIEHAAAFLGRSPGEVSRAADLLCRAQLAAWEYYQQTPVIAGIDVYHLEVEAWGATVRQPADNGSPVLDPPTVAEPRALLALPALDLRRDGRLPLTLAAATQLRAAGATVCVPMAGPVSIAAGLLGFETLLTAMLTEPDAVAAALRHLAARQAGLARQWLAAGFSSVLYESAGGPPLVSPALFRTLVAPALHTIFAAVPMPCIMGGDTARVAAELLAAGPTAVLCPAETDPAVFLAAAAAQPQVAIRINLPAVTFAQPEWAAAQAALARAAALARGRPGVSLGTGVLPYAAERDFVRRAMRAAERL